jgi:formylmethanofuran dehydrogenase subunit E
VAPDEPKPVHCDDCGELAAVTFEDRTEDATGYRGDKSYCLACLEKHEAASR